MKKKATRYQTGGVLRDRFGNPVRSGSGDVVRTSYPDRSYDEQASASMTESSDYSGRGARSPERTAESSMTSDYMPSRKAVDIGFGGAEEESRKITDYIRTSPKEDSVSETIKEEVKAKPKPRKRVSQKFPVDKSGMKKRSTQSMEEFLSNKTKTGSGAYGFKFKSGGKVSSASSRADGIAQRGKTRGRMC